MLRHDRFIELAREHHAALRLAVRLRRGGDASELRQLVDAERAALERHFDEEDDWVEQELLRLGETAMSQRMAEEHLLLRELLATAYDEDSLQRLGTLLHDHARFEDRELFPCVEAHWQAAQS